MPFSAFWQRFNFGETLSEEAEKVLGYVVVKHFLATKCTFRILVKAYYGEALSEEAEKVLGYLIDKHFLRFL